MPAPSLKLEEMLDRLESLYGRPDPPPVTDPLEMILFENIAYLASDERRRSAWKAFVKQIGAAPSRILAARASALRAIAEAGILAADRAEKVKNVAAIAQRDFDGDLNGYLDAHPDRARKALQKFPGIGEPGAEKILLFSRREKTLALDSNALRVLLRLGFGKEQKSYAASYRSAQEATRAQWKPSYPWLIRAHQLLRRHGQELCKRTHPRCDRCPLARVCAYFLSGRASGT